MEPDFMLILSHPEKKAEWPGGHLMGKCLKGDSEVKKKDAKFACGKCGARTDKKAHVCKPEKLKVDKKK
jgi:Zn finger protein HypA/HybF involved in hydrogenase expression